jgi:hypothetical protein
VTKAIIALLRALGAGQVSAQIGSVDDSAKAASGAFAVEPLHTRVLFGVSHFGFTTYYGEFSGVSGALDLDPKNPSASKLDIRIPVASIGTTNAELNDELKGEQWFDTVKYPNISFKATKVTMTGPGKPMSSAISLCMERRSRSFCTQYSTGQGSIRSTSTTQWASMRSRRLSGPSSALAHMCLSSATMSTSSLARHSSVRVSSFGERGAQESQLHVYWRSYDALSAVRHSGGNRQGIRR